MSGIDENERGRARERNAQLCARKQTRESNVFRRSERREE
jgi:hypothetical protein